MSPGPRMSSQNMITEATAGRTHQGREYVGTNDESQAPSTFMGERKENNLQGSEGKTRKAKVR